MGEKSQDVTLQYFASDASTEYRCLSRVQGARLANRVGTALISFPRVINLAGLRLGSSDLRWDLEWSPGQAPDTLTLI